MTIRALHHFFTTDHPDGSQQAFGQDTLILLGLAVLFLAGVYGLSHFLPLVAHLVLLAVGLLAGVLGGAFLFSGLSWPGVNLFSALAVLPLALVAALAGASYHWPQHVFANHLQQTGVQVRDVVLSSSGAPVVITDHGHFVAPEGHLIANESLTLKEFFYNADDPDAVKIHLCRPDLCVEAERLPIVSL